MLLRFDPADANRQSSHPPASQRLEVILATLEWMASTDRFGSPYGELVQRIRAQWSERSGLRVPAASNDSARVDVAGAVPELHHLLEAHLVQLRYGSFARAQRVRTALGGSRGAALARDGLTIPDVLNGAWLARVGVGEAATAAIDGIERQAIALATSLLEEGAGVTPTLADGSHRVVRPVAGLIDR
jgi:hypothetical protein